MKMIINIVGGRGIMGSIHKPVFEAAGHTVIISGRNSNPSMEDAAKNSDLTIISVPIPAVEETIRKIAPFCKAIMDFTSIKTISINAMLKYSNKDCEVAGLHPLYGAVSSIKDRTVIYCPTKKSGKKCESIINTFKKAGAKIITATPEEHDRVIAITQNARNKILDAYANLIKDSGITIEEIYKFSPPPTKIILDLIARQIDESNDEIYQAMQDKNPNNAEVFNNLINSIKAPKNNPEKLRQFFSTQLKPAQDRAKNFIEGNK